MQLIDFTDQLIELVVQFKGGHCNHVGRVRNIKDKNLWVGNACLPIDAEVRHHSIDNTYVFKVNDPKLCAEKAAQAEEDRVRESIDHAWENWEEHNKIHFARPSVNYTPYQIAFTGRCILVALPGYGEGRPYISVVLNNPNWGRVVECFDNAIMQTGDKHHVFMEGLRPLEVTRWPKGISVPMDVEVLEFCTGS